MIGIILAAGRGSRMGKSTANKPKSFIVYKKKKLIDHILQNFKKTGINKIYIITGYKKKLFDSVKVKKIYNNKWKSTNIFYSLYKARRLMLKEPCIISYADIYYDYLAIKKLKPRKDLITVLSYKLWKNNWKKRFLNPLSDLESFDYDKKGYLSKIGEKVKNIKGVKGQFSGLFKITPKGWLIVENYLSKKNKNKFFKKDITGFLKDFIKTKKKIVKIRNYSGKWNEIDRQSDLKL